MKSLNQIWKMTLLIVGLLIGVSPAFADKQLMKLDKQARVLGEELAVEKQKMQSLGHSGCKTKEIHFDDIPGRENPSKEPRISCFAFGSVDAVNTNKQIEVITKQILINRLEANQRRFEIKSKKTSEQEAYQELSSNIKKILAHEVMNTLSAKTRDEVRAIANQFLEKSKQAKTEAGISTCTNCADKGPIQDLSKFIEQMKK